MFGIFTFNEFIIVSRCMLYIDNNLYINICIIDN
nr:MAG TPA: hypothetical protein [Caudoviricetes sp.]